MRNDKELANSTNRTQRITEIAQEIEALTSELNLLILEGEEEDKKEQENQERKPRANKKEHTETANELQEGDIVIITNNYKGLKGRRGKIVSISKAQVAVLLEDTNRIVQKRKYNVTRVGNK